MCKDVLLQIGLNEMYSVVAPGVSVTRGSRADTVRACTSLAHPRHA